MKLNIKLSNELLSVLKKRKINEEDSYEDIIWDLVEDTLELSEETKRNIAQSREEYKQGKVYKFEDVKKELLF